MQIGNAVRSKTRHLVLTQLLDDLQHRQVICVEASLVSHEASERETLPDSVHPSLALRALRFAYPHFKHVRIGHIAWRVEGCEIERLLQ